MMFARFGIRVQLSELNFYDHNQGSVVQNFVSLTLSLILPQYVNYISIHSVILKNNSVFVILPFEILSNR